MKRIMVVLVAVLSMAGLVRAQAPATAPATGPAAVSGPVDQTTPQGTLILLTRTMQSGDVAGARQLLHASTPEETVLAGLFVQAVEVNTKFRAAVSKAFGEGVADTYVGSAADVAEAEKSIRAAPVKIENDSASVQSRPGDEPVKLVRVEGKWKLAMGAIGADEMARTQEDFKIRLTVLDSIATEVAAGKFKSPDEMGAEMRNKLAAEVLKAAAQTPATQPAPAGAK